MADKAIKTEHAGAKHGSGSYWGPKREAKRESNKRRRSMDRVEVMSSDRYEVRS